MRYKILFLSMLILFTSCLRLSSKPLTDEYTPASGTLPTDASENINYKVTINNLSSSEVYMVITNELFNCTRNNTITFTRTSSNLASKNITTSTNNNSFIIPRTFKYDYSKPLISKKSITEASVVQKSSVGDIKTFNILKMGTSETHTTLSAVLAKSVSKGDRTINFWVDNSKYSSSSDVIGKINNTMINILANKFIMQNNSIYDDLTTIFGKEWFDSSSNKDYLINGNKSIDILLFDINKSYDGGRVIGYFNPDDLFTKSSSTFSNERVMFYLDAHSFLDSTPWSISDYWPDNVISTLAHEFTHLITFYQKTVLRSGKISTWLNEMISMLAEDLVSYDIGSYGPRGVLGTDLSSGHYSNTMGRLPYANYFNNFPPNSYDMSSYIEYSVTYSYGAYLLRNFATGTNGLEFLKSLVYNQYSDVNAIEEAIKTTGYNRNFLSTIQDWSKAIILSNQTFTSNELYKYQTGTGFSSTINGKTFKFGDINMYTYSDTPTFYSSGGANLPSLNRASNLMFFLGTSTGTFNMNISIPKYSRMAFYIKNSSGYFDKEKSSSVEIKALN